MSLERRNKREIKRSFANTDGGRIESLIDGFIRSKYLVVDAKNYHVSILEELWNMYKGQKKRNFLNNIRFYCSIKNAFNRDKVSLKRGVLISVNTLINGVSVVKPKFIYKYKILFHYNRITRFIFVF